MPMIARIFTFTLIAAGLQSTFPVHTMMHYSLREGHRNLVAERPFRNDVGEARGNEFQQSTLSKEERLYPAIVVEYLQGETPTYNTIIIRDEDSQVVRNQDDNRSDFARCFGVHIETAQALINRALLFEQKFLNYLHDREETPQKTSDCNPTDHSISTCEPSPLEQAQWHQYRSLRGAIQAVFKSAPPDKRFTSEATALLNRHIAPLLTPIISSVSWARQPMLYPALVHKAKNAKHTLIAIAYRDIAMAIQEQSFKDTQNEIEKRTTERHTKMKTDPAFRKEEITNIVRQHLLQLGLSNSQFLKYFSYEPNKSIEELCWHVRNRHFCDLWNKTMHQKRPRTPRKCLREHRLPPHESSASKKACSSSQQCENHMKNEFPVPPPRKLQKRRDISLAVSNTRRQAALTRWNNYRQEKEK